MSFVNGFQRTAVFISGGGSCLQTMLDHSEFQNTTLVITNKKMALGALKARRFGLQVIVMTSKMSFEDIHHILVQQRIQKIFLAGFMKMIPVSFLELWTDRIFNIHPSLLPNFKGLHAFESAFHAGADLGATIHHVTAEMDAGEIVLQQTSSKADRQLTEAASYLYLRRTEQNLVRDFVIKGSILCTRF